MALFKSVIGPVPVKPIAHLSDSSLIQCKVKVPVGPYRKGEILNLTPGMIARSVHFADGAYYYSGVVKTGHLQEVT